MTTPVTKTGRTVRRSVIVEIVGDTPSSRSDRVQADRVAGLGGKLEVESPPGAGTRVRATIPLGS